MKSLESLIPTLVTATENGKVRWQEKFGGTSFEANMKNATTLTVSTWEDENTGDTGLRIGLTPSPSAPFTKELDYHYATDGGVGFATLNKLYQSARRSANNVDQLIGEIEAALNDDDF